jgi:hypothetical protein
MFSGGFQKRIREVQWEETTILVLAQYPLRKFPEVVVFENCVNFFATLKFLTHFDSDLGCGNIFATVVKTPVWNVRSAEGTQQGAQEQNIFSKA